MLASSFICFTIVAIWLSCIIYLISDGIKIYSTYRKEKKAYEELKLREIQDGCNALWVAVFEQKRAEKGELWACEHLESYGLIER